MSMVWRHADVTDAGINEARKFLEQAVTGTLKTYGKGEKVGLLFGAMDMSYNADVMLGALAQIYATQADGSIDTNMAEKFIADVKANTVGQQLSDVLKYISGSASYSSLKKYVANIQVIDAVVAEMDPDAVGRMAEQRAC